MKLSLIAVLVLAVAGCDDKKAAVQPAQKPANKLTVACGESSRELFKAVAAAFVADYKKSSGKLIEIEIWPGTSTAQAQEIINGRKIDVAALAQDTDIDAIAAKGLIATNWRERHPNASSPYSTVVVFLVHHRNPRGIKDWSDLARTGNKLVSAHPKSGGRPIYLSAWGAMLKAKKTEEQARDIVGKIYRQTQFEPEMHLAAERFARQAELDVLFGQENQILALANDPQNKERFRVETPYSSVVIEMPIAVIDKHAGANGNAAIAEAFVKFAFSKEGQELAAKHFHRPTDPEVFKKHTQQFPRITTYPAKELFGDPAAVTSKFFADGAVFDLQMQER